MKHCACLLALLPSCILFSQDIHFSQHLFAPLHMNPASAGAGHDVQAILNYKNQWSAVDTRFSTFDVAFDMKLNQKKPKEGFWAGGLTAFSDKAGDSKMGTNQVNGMVGYHTILGAKSTFGGAAQVGYAQRSIRYDALRWGSQYNGMAYDAGIPTGEPAGGNSFSYLDLGAGILYTYKKAEGYMTGNDQVKIDAGLSVFHFHQPKYSFYGSGERLYMKIVAHADALIGLKNTPLSLQPSLMFYRQGPAQEIYIGTMVKYMLREESKYTGYVKGAAVSGGCYYRHRDAIVPAFMIEMGQYAFGLSYDVNISKLKSASFGRGGIEFAFRFVNPNPFIFKSASRF